MLIQWRTQGWGGEENSPDPLKEKRKGKRGKKEGKMKKKCEKIEKGREN